MKLNKNLILFTAILVVLTTACKFFFGPDLDWSGFSPMIAIALFSGMILRKKDIGFLLPLISLVISDALIELMYEQNLFPYAGFYSYQLINYSILMLAVLIGWAFKGKSYGSLAAGAIIAPTAFYLVSNFMVWLTGEVVYSRDFAGLMTCYYNALPFYKNALIATIIFFPAILFTYNGLMRKKAALIVA